MGLALLVGMRFQRLCISQYFLNVCLHQCKIVVFARGQLCLLAHAFLYVIVSVCEFNIKVVKVKLLLLNSKFSQHFPDRFSRILWPHAGPVLPAHLCGSFRVRLCRPDGQRHLPLCLFLFCLACHFRQVIFFSFRCRLSVGSVFVCPAVCFQRRAVAFARVRLVVEPQLLQVFQLLLGQRLCRPRRRVGGLLHQQALDVRQHLLQHGADLLHHPLALAQCAGVLLRFQCLLAQIIAEALLAAKDALHRVGSDLLHGLVVGQALACLLVPVKVAFHQLHHAVHAVLLHKVVFKGVDHLLCARAVPAVRRVEGLVQHRGRVRLAGVEHLPDAALDQALCPVFDALSHPLCRKAVGSRRQPDQLVPGTAAAVLGAVAVVQGSCILPQCRRIRLSAKLCRLGLFVAFGFAPALGVGHLQRQPPGLAGRQHLPHRAAQCPAAGHLQRLRKALALAVHAQPVQACRRRGVHLGAHALRHIPAHALRCRIAHPPALRQLLHGRAFHRFPGVFHPISVDIPRPL